MNTDPIVLSTDVVSVWKADVKAWAAGDLTVKPCRPPVRLGVTICSASLRWGDGDTDIPGTFKGGVVYANCDRISDEGEIVEAWKVIDLHHGQVTSWVIDADDILDWNDGILVYSGEIRWDRVAAVQAKVMTAAGRRGAPRWLDDAAHRLYILTHQHRHGGDTDG